MIYLTTTWYGILTWECLIFLKQKAQIEAEATHLRLWQTYEESVTELKPKIEGTYRGSNYYTASLRMYSVTGVYTCIMFANQ
jgi:hypothetical protein